MKGGREREEGEGREGESKGTRKERGSGGRKGREREEGSGGKESGGERRGGGKEGGKGSQTSTPSPCATTYSVVAAALSAAIFSAGSTAPCPPSRQPRHSHGDK
jgi:hypothetical protein